MKVWRDVDQGLHDPGSGSPERPDRLDACLTALLSSGVEVLLQDAFPADRALVDLVHERSNIDALEEFCHAGGGLIAGDTFANQSTFDVALRAAGACVDAAREALSSGDAALSLVRPPGHHATRDEAMGFCFINNVAVATKAVQAAGATRVCIIDFDVHHGNGSQDIFWQDPDVCYLSLHQWPWYPWISGALEEIGAGEAEGTNVNIPLPAMTGDVGHLSAIEGVVVPVVRQFEPDMIMVSAGFDAHVDDPLSMQEVTTGGFGAIARSLTRLAAEVCGGRALWVLEGGYNLVSLGASVAEVAGALAGSPTPADPPPLSHGSGFRMPALDKVIAFHGRRWNLDL
ncbi:MAG: histone deacetylase [Actinomycetota bacterium]|nr:histone deacetylase [Actinomycetota bacterium]